MGFGLLLFGYLLCTLDLFGLGIIGAPLMYGGALMLRKIDKRFICVAILAVLQTWQSVLNIFILANIINSENTIYFVSYFISLIIGGLFHITLAIIIRDITKKSSPKMAQKAITSMVFALIYYVWYIIHLIIRLPGLDMILFGYYFIFKVIVIFFIWDCYAKITTRFELEKNKRIHRKIQAEYEERKKKREKKEE